MSKTKSGLSFAIKNTPPKGGVGRFFLQSESGTIIRKYKGNPHIALAYPNSYFTGMSSLAVHTLYKLLNDDGQVVCERVFFEKQNDQKGLRTLETNAPVQKCDCVMLSISFESDFLNILPLLDQAGIPLLTKDRTENDPIIFAGGAAVTINPEPIADFVDVVFMGEAEEAIPQIIEALRAPTTRQKRLEALTKIEGVFPGTNVLRTSPRRIVRNLNFFPTQTVIYTPQTEMGDMALIEVQRGCPRGCKFCAAGFIYAPFRERNLNVIKQGIQEALTQRNKIGLIGADLLSSPHLADIMRFVLEHGGTCSPSSVRVDQLTPEVLDLLVRSGHKTLSVAPETGSDKLRASLNKKFSNRLFLEQVDLVFKAGIRNLKTYFMIGLPNETEEDIAALIELVKATHALLLKHGRAAKQMGTLSMSINPFIPKPHTPFAKETFAGVTALKIKVDRIKKELSNFGNLKFTHKNLKEAEIQAMLSNGMRETSSLILKMSSRNFT